MEFCYVKAHMVLLPVKRSTKEEEKAREIARASRKKNYVNGPF